MTHHMAKSRHMSEFRRFDAKPGVVRGPCSECIKGFRSLESTCETPLAMLRGISLGRLEVPGGLLGADARRAGQSGCASRVARGVQDVPQDFGPGRGCLSQLAS